MAKAAVAGTKSKMYNRRTWTKEENQQLQDGIASFGGPNADFGKNVSFFCVVLGRMQLIQGRTNTQGNSSVDIDEARLFTVAYDS